MEEEDSTTLSLITFLGFIALIVGFIIALSSYSAEIRRVIMVALAIFTIIGEFYSIRMLTSHTPLSWGWILASLVIILGAFLLLVIPFMATREF